MSQKLLLTAMLVVAAIALGQTRSQRRGGIDSSDAMPATGSAVAGKALFDGSGNCLSCHRVGAAGSGLAPNLSDVGSRLSPDEMKHRLMDPPTKIDPKNRICEIELVGGRTVRGKLLNQDPFSLQMLDSDGQLVAYSRSEIRDVRTIDPPQMPSYKDSFTSAQIDDLIAYLVSLHTPQN